MAVSIEVKLLDGSSSEFFEGRTIMLGCVNNTISHTSTVWYKNDEVINDVTIRNLTLTLKGSDTGLYKCRINGKNSTNNFYASVKGMNLGVF